MTVLDMDVTTLKAQGRYREKCIDALIGVLASRIKTVTEYQAIVTALISYSPPSITAQS